MTTDNQQTTTTIKDLCNEILFDIFDYFWTSDIIRSFSLLFPHLLNDRLLRLHVRLTSHTEEHRFISSVLPFIQPEQIVSLSLISLKTLLPIERLINLQSFSLEYSYSEDYRDFYNQIFDQLSQLPKLNNLSIELGRKHLAMANHIIRLIFETLSLRRFYLRSYGSQKISIPSTFNSSTIEYISLRSIGDLREINSFLQCVNNVRTVHLIGFSLSSIAGTSLILPNVNQLIVTNCSFSPLDILSELIKNVFPNISKLNIGNDVGANDLQTYLDGEKWKSLFVLQKLKRILKKIKVDIRFQVYKYQEIRTYMDQFDLDAYFSQWNFHLEHFENNTIRLRCYSIL